MKKEIAAIIVGIFLIAVSIAIPAVPIIVMLTEKAPEKFLVPGSVEVNVEDAGRYYLWNNYRTLYKDKTYSTGKETPGGLVISLASAEGGKSREITPSSSMSSSGGSEEKATIGYYDLDKGKYVLKVEGQVEERVFSFGRNLSGGWIITLVAGFFLPFIFIPIGMAIIIIAVVLIIKKTIERSRK